MTNTMSPGEMILLARTRARLKQTCVARLLGIHVAALIEVERGRMEPSERWTETAIRTIETHAQKGASDG